MSEIVAIKPPPLPPIACPQGGCHGHVTIDGPDDLPFWSCTVCLAGWDLDGTPLLIRHDCLTCGAVNIQPRGHDCAPFLKLRGVGS